MPQPKQPATPRTARPKAAPAGRAATPKPRPAAAPKPKPASTSAPKAKPAAAPKPKLASAPKAKTAAAPKPKRAAAPRPKASAPRPASRPAAEPAAAPEPTSAAARDEALRANLAALRDLLAGGVVLTAQRLQEAVDEAVTRGRITRRDAEDLASGLLNAGRQQTQDMLADLEQLLGRGRSDLASARSITKATVKGSERMLREVDRARRAAGIGASFPILGYDDLTASQIVKRVGDLTAPELRKVRDHERRHAARKSVLKAIKKALA